MSGSALINGIVNDLKQPNKPYIRAVENHSNSSNFFLLTQLCSLLFIIDSHIFSCLDDFGYFWLYFTPVAKQDSISFRSIPS